jgi:chemotaxis protein CheC
MTMSFSFQPVHLDLLKEIGNLGSAHAATALSTLTNQSIDMTVPSVRVTNFMDVINEEDRERFVIAAHFDVFGDFQAHLFITFDLNEAEQLLRRLIHNDSLSIEEARTSPYYRSALDEVGNIMAGSYITALADFSGMTIQLSPPQLGMDIAGALIGEGLIEMSLHGDEVILVDTVLRNRETDRLIKGSFLLLPQLESVQLLFRKLGVQHD